MIDNVTLDSIKVVFFDFDGVFTDNSVWVDHNGVESVRCCRSDGLGLQKIKKLGIRAHIISTEKNPVVLVRAEKLNIPCTHGVEDKLSEIKRLCDIYQVTLKEVMFVGNDINDISALEEVGYPVAVADSYLEILPYVKYKTSRLGGYGAVREICDLIADAFIMKRDE